MDLLIFKITRNSNRLAWNNLSLFLYWRIVQPTGDKQWGTLRFFSLLHSADNDFISMYKGYKSGNIRDVHLH